MPPGTRSGVNGLLVTQLETRLDPLIENVSSKVGEDAVGYSEAPRQVTCDVQRYERVRLEIVSIEAIKIFTRETK